MRKKTFLMVTAISLLFFSLSQGHLDARTERIGREMPIGQRCVVGKQYLLVIAINRYQHWKPLAYPVQEAKEIKKILTDRYYVDEVFELYDEEATHDNIILCFNNLQNSLKVNDSLLIFYSGHGNISSDIGFWIPVDGVHQSERTMRSWLPNNVLKKLIDKIPSKHILLISDSCFSGDLLESEKGEASCPVIDIKHFREAYSLRCRQAITVGTGKEKAPGRSEFASGLKTILVENGELIMDGVMLYDSLRRKVKKTLPLFDYINGTSYDRGSGFLFFLKKDKIFWEEWQKRFRNAVKEVKKKDGDSSIPGRGKIKIYQKVLKEFAYNNPFSNEDEYLRKDIEGKIESCILDEKCEASYSMALKQYKKKHYEEVDELLKEMKECDKKFQEKVDELKKKIQKETDDLAYEIAKKVNTVEAFLAYLEEFPDGKHRAEAHFNCGILYLEKRDSKEAQEHFTETIKINDKDAEAHNNSGICYKLNGESKESIKEYDIAIKHYKARVQTKKIKRNLAIVYNNRGGSRFKIGKKEEALQDYNEALKLHKKYGNAYYNLGLYYLDSKDFEEARKKFKKAVKYNKKDSEARRLLEEVKKMAKEKAGVKKR